MASIATSQAGRAKRKLPTPRLQERSWGHGTRVGVSVFEVMVKDLFKKSSSAILITIQRLFSPRRGIQSSFDQIKTALTRITF